MCGFFAKVISPSLPNGCITAIANVTMTIIHYYLAVYNLFAYFGCVFARFKVVNINLSCYNGFV